MSQDGELEVKNFIRAYTYYSFVIEKLLTVEYRNNDFGYLPYYITQLQLRIRSFMVNHEEATTTITTLLDDLNPIGWYFLLNAIGESQDQQLLDKIEELASFQDGLIYPNESPTMDILGMLDLLVRQINKKNSIIEIKSPPKFHDLRHKASSILIRSNRDIPEVRDFTSMMENQPQFSVKNLQQIIEQRRCCQMNGKYGDSYCNICGKIIPNDFKMIE